jgi:hypothetical protein
MQSLARDRHPWAARFNPSISIFVICIMARMTLIDLRNPCRPTKNETAGVNANMGPPFSVMNSWPSRWNVADMTLPSAPARRRHSG